MAHKDRILEYCYEWNEKHGCVDTFVEQQRVIIKSHILCDFLRQDAIQRYEYGSQMTPLAVTKQACPLIAHDEFITSQDSDRDSHAYLPWSSLSITLFCARENFPKCPKVPQTMADHARNHALYRS